MSQVRSSSAGSGAGAGAGTSNNSSSSGGGGVLSKVLGSIRGASSGDGDPATNNTTGDTNWLNTFKITHHPDRPRQDKREALRRRDSADVLRQMHKIWRYNEKMVETKRRERATRERGALPSLRTDVVPNFSWKSASPEFARNKWQDGDEVEQNSAGGIDENRERHHRPVIPPSSFIPPSPDQMTIRVGLDLDSPDGREGFGGYGRSYHDTTPALPPTPTMTSSSSTTPLGPASRSVQNGIMAPGRHTRHLPRSPPPPPPQLKPTAVRPAMIARQPIPASATRTSVDTGYINRGFPPPTRPRIPEICPMPLCNNTLLMATDRKQNMCAECRGELQSQRSVYTDVLNPFTRGRPSTRKHGHTASSTSAVSGVQYCSAAEVAEARLETLPGTVYREGKPKTADRDGGGSEDQPVVDRDGVQMAEIPPSPPRRKKSVNSKVASRFNKDRGGFGLGRKHTRRGREPPSGQGIAKQKPTSPLRDGTTGTVQEGRGHISFQLMNWQTSPLPANPAKTTPESNQPQHIVAGSNQPRKMSGPMLEPKTFCPPTTAPARQRSKSKSKVGSILRRRPSRSGSRSRGKGGRVAANAASPRSPGRRKNQPQQLDHSHQTEGSRATGPTGKEPGDTAADSSTNTNARGSDKGVEADSGAGEDEAVGDGDIYYEIESVIDCYLRLVDAPESENQRRKVEAVTSYFGAVPHDVKMNIQGFF